MGDEYQADIPVWGEGGGVAAVDARQGLGQGSGQGLAYELIHTAHADDDNDEQSHQQQQRPQPHQGIGSMVRNPCVCILLLYPHFPLLDYNHYPRHPPPFPPLISPLPFSPFVSPPSS